MRKYLNGREIGHVFIKNNGTSICAGTIEKDAKMIAKNGECKDPVTVHTYRKTFASREYVRTRDILYVSKRLGHANTAVTIKYYICDDVESDRRIAYGAS